MAQDALEGTDGNGNLLHSDKNSPGTTRDKLDLGAPMAPGDGPQGPEDAFSETPTRGDYTGKIGQTGPSYTSRQRPDGTVEMVRQDTLNTREETN